MFFGAALTFEALIMRRHLQTACPAGPSTTDRQIRFLPFFSLLLSSRLVSSRSRPAAEVSLSLVPLARVYRRMGRVPSSRSTGTISTACPPCCADCTACTVRASELGGSMGVHHHHHHRDYYCLRAPCPEKANLSIPRNRAPPRLIYSLPPLANSSDGKLIPTDRSTTNRRRSASHTNNGVGCLTLLLPKEADPLLL
jgi:hypothetical protein